MQKTMQTINDDAHCYCPLLCHCAYMEGSGRTYRNIGHSEHTVHGTLYTVQCTVYSSDMHTIS